MPTHVFSVLNPLKVKLSGGEQKAKEKPSSFVFWRTDLDAFNIELPRKGLAILWWNVNYTKLQHGDFRAVAGVWTFFLLDLPFSLAWNTTRAPS